MKIMCFVISCLLSLACRAQIQYDQLEGIWKFTKGEFKGGDYFDSASHTEYIVFEHNNVYKRYGAYFVKKAGNITDTTYQLDSGVWKLNEKKGTISITENYYFNNGIWKSNITEKYTDTIISLGGKSLVLIDLESIKMTYERAYKVPAYLVSKTHTVPGEKYFPPKPYIPLNIRKKTIPPLKLYRKDSTKVVFARYTEPISIYLHAKNPCPLCACNYEYLSGDVDSAKGDKFYMLVNQRTINYRDTLGNNYNNTIYYSWYIDTDSNGLSTFPMPQFESIPLSKINTVYYNPPVRKRLYEDSETFMYLTGFSALIVSPLVSINYRKGTFNSHRYFGWAGWSLAGFGASLTVNLLTGERAYKVVLPNGNY